MKKHLLILIAVNLVAFGLWAGPLKIVNVNFPQINCLFSTNCTVTTVDSSAPITFNGATGSGRMLTRMFNVATNSPMAGRYSYAYRIDLSTIMSPTTNDYIDSLRINFGPIVPFTYNGIPSNMVWVATVGGVGNVAPSSALQLGNEVTFRFNPPIFTASPVAKGQSTFTIGMISIHPPTNFTATITGFQGSGQPIPLNPNVLVRSPRY